VDAFFTRTPDRVWEEYKVAVTLIDSYDAWLESLRHGNKKPWKPPEFKPGTGRATRRRIDGTPY